MLKRWTRVFWTLIYYGFATHLPSSYQPFGRQAKRLRALCAKHMLGHCGCNINIERRVNLGSGRQVSLGDNSGVGRNSSVQAICVGNNVMIVQELLQVSQNHHFDDLSAPMICQGMTQPETARIESDCWIGARVTIVPGGSIGTGTVVGAGAVVTRALPSYSICGGVPARVIRFRAPFDAASHDVDNSVDGRRAST